VVGHWNEEMEEEKWPQILSMCWKAWWHHKEQTQGCDFHYFHSKSTCSTYLSSVHNIIMKLKIYIIYILALSLVLFLKRKSEFSFKWEKENRKMFFFLSKFKKYQIWKKKTIILTKYVLKKNWSTFYVTLPSSSFPFGFGQRNKHRNKMSH